MLKLKQIDGLIAALNNKASKAVIESGSYTKVTVNNEGIVTGGNNLNSADLPIVPVTKGGTGLSSLTSGSFLRGNGTGNVSLRTAAQVKSDIELGNVTNHAQVRKAVSSTDGVIPKWSGADGVSIIDGFTPRTTLRASASADDVSIATEKAVRTAVDAIAMAVNAMDYKGAIDASTNPNYPAASKGDTYKFSANGKIGGADGVTVYLGDFMICVRDTVGGTQGTVGEDWDVFHLNREGEVIGPSSATNGNISVFDGTTGKLIKDGGVGVDALLGKLDYAYSIDASSNPNYPAASKGQVFDISVAGKIGGVNGVEVGVGDLLICLQNVLGGAQGEVGSSWARIRRPNEVLGPSSSANNRIAVFDGTTGKLIKDGGSTIADIVSGQVNLRNKQHKITGNEGSMATVITITNALTESVMSGTVPTFSVNGLSYPMGDYASLNIGEWAFSGSSIRVRLPYDLETDDVILIIYNY